MTFKLLAVSVILGAAPLYDLPADVAARGAEAGRALGANDDWTAWVKRL